MKIPNDVPPLAFSDRKVKALTLIRLACKDGSITNVELNFLLKLLIKDLDICEKPKTDKVK